MQKFEEHEKRLARLEDETWKDKVIEKLAELQASVANLNGRLVGYVLAAGVLGSVVAFIATKVFH